MTSATREEWSRLVRMDDGTPNHPSQTIRTILWWDALAVAVVAAVVRLVYLLELRGDPFWSGLISNARSYHREAQAVAEGQLLPVDSGFQPLYGTLMGLVYAVVGADVGAMRWLQLGLGALIAAGVLVAAARVGGRTAGWVAGLAWALYWPSVFYGGELLPDVLITALVVAALVPAWRALERGGWWRWVLAGVALGVASLGKPNAALLSLWVPAAAAAWPGLAREVRVRRAATSLLVPALAIAGVLAAPALFSGHTPGITSAFGWKVIWDGNHEGGDGTNPFWAEYRHAAEARIWEDTTDYEAIATWFREDLQRFVREQPGAWTALQARKAWVFASSYEVDGNGTVVWRRDRSAWLRPRVWPAFGVLLAGTLMGVVAHRRRWREHLLPWAWAATWAASIVAIQVNGRYRLPTAAIACVLAGLGAAALIRAVRGGDRRGTALLIVAAALGAGIATVDLAGIRDYRVATLVRLEAEVLEEAGDVAGAERHLRSAVDLPVGGAMARRTLGLLLARQGLADEAIEQLEAAVQQEPWRSELHEALGTTLRDAGRPGEALVALDEAATLAPDDASVAYNRGLSLMDQGEPALAVEAFDRAEALAYDDLGPLWLMRGVASAQLSRWERAEADLRAAGGVPEVRGQAMANLGLLLLRTDRAEEARKAWWMCLDDPTCLRRYCASYADWEELPVEASAVCPAQEPRPSP